MLEELLIKEEGKTLEFKENTKSLQKIIQTIVAFANTAGGTLVIGIKDRTKDVIGLADVLEEEERIANVIADSVSPLLIPSLQLHTWRDRDLLIISVPHSFGPYYIKSKGIEEGTYVRFGSTNRLADATTILEIQRLKEHKYFDEQPNFDCAVNEVDFDLAKELFANISKKLTDRTAKSLGLIIQYHAKELPSNGAVLLFSDRYKDFFPDAIIRLGRFSGTNKSQIIDQQALEVPISIALEPIIAFIRRHTSMAAEIGKTRRKDILQYPPVVIREAVVNALLHTDYSIKGASIQVAIFEDRIEITNPGCLPFGLSFEAALSGISQLRNRVIGRVFRELNLIEQWGSGLGRMLNICKQQGIPLPKFEELGNFFRTTLYYHSVNAFIGVEEWQKQIIEYLKEHKEILPKKAQGLWKVTARTTSSRLKKMCSQGVLVEISTGPYDPQKKFSLRN
ncbi:MAG TPA: ATP-binding protein [Candidatus Rhabdochlamydia sp.]|jgi:ATP-dependent DNA helicase RecG|nr:ATP-binding protein [Candidatus Rhabdochlamydia sp.]